MAPAIVDAHIEAKLRLQRAIIAAVTIAWQQLPHYNRAQLDQWLSTVLPLAAAANQQSVALTQAFIARMVGQPPQGLDIQGILAGIRNGTDPETVYTRSFISLWSALKRGTGWEQAVKIGLDRATNAAATDVQLSFTHTIAAAGDAGGRITAWQRVPDPAACDYCVAAASQLYYTGDLLPLHGHCGCGVMPADMAGGGRFGGKRFSGAGGLQVAVRDHGELGPLLTNANDAFTGPAAIPGH